MRESKVLEPFGDGELTARFRETVSLAKRCGLAGLLLVLDDVDRTSHPSANTGVDPLAVVVSAVFRVQQDGLPLALVLGGLPTLTRRLFRAAPDCEALFTVEELGPLDAEAAQDALVEPIRSVGVTISGDVVLRVIARTAGNPYLLQVWGAALLDRARATYATHIDLATFSVVDKDIDDVLAADFYNRRLYAVPAAEVALLRVAARCNYPPLRNTELAERSQMKRGFINVELLRLVDHGVLYRVAQGEYEYAIPLLNEFLVRRFGAPLRPGGQFDKAQQGG
ncbi:MAG: hypothetical protein WB116_11800 [Candidatus Dormiibacterota bacterium]